MRLCVSRCLLGEPCRYDGRSKPLPPGSLPPGADLVPFCPELAAGLGCPREPIELVGTAADAAPGTLPGPRALGVGSRRDATPALLRACEAEAAALAAAGGVDGFVLKDRSPSCGLRTPVHDPATGAIVGHGPGVWARTALRRFPSAAFSDSGSLAPR